LLRGGVSRPKAEHPVNRKEIPRAVVHGEGPAASSKERYSSSYDGKCISIRIDEVLRTLRLQNKNGTAGLSERGVRWRGKKKLNPKTSLILHGICNKGWGKTKEEALQKKGQRKTSYLQWSVREGKLNAWGRTRLIRRPFREQSSGKQWRENHGAIQLESLSTVKNEKERGTCGG